jgi:hypothetical protein
MNSCPGNFPATLVMNQPMAVPVYWQASDNVYDDVKCTENLLENLPSVPMEVAWVAS